MVISLAFFQSFRGVWQGENLPPVLFALFLNDLEFFLSTRNCSGIDLELLMIVIFGTDETEFQNNLNAFYEYSNMWRLDINYDKTKILIFGTHNDNRFDF